LIKNLFKKTDFITLTITIILALIQLKFNENIYTYAVNIVFLLLLIYIGITIFTRIKGYFDDLKLKNSNSRIIYLLSEFDWRIYDNGNFNGNFTYIVKNISDEDVTDLPYDDIHWYNDYDDIDIQFKILDNNDKKYHIIDYRNNLYNQLFNYFKKKVKVISWSHIIEPSLKPNDILKYSIIINTTNSEKDAFSDVGAFAGVPAIVPIKEATINYSAPLGYKFEIITPLIIVDIKGTEITTSEDKANYDLPELNTSKTILKWRLFNLKAGRRYWFKYKLIKDVENEI